jgi:hypothetical protein
MLRWVVEEGCPCDERACKTAMSIRCLEMLQFAREELKCPWNEDVCSEAAFMGRLDMLMWAVENGCPWDKEACSEAAGRGYQSLESYKEMIDWIKAQA